MDYFLSKFSVDVLTAIANCSSVPNNTSARVLVDSVHTSTPVQTRIAGTVVDHYKLKQLTYQATERLK